jgi:hypothetical protein
VWFWAFFFFFKRDIIQNVGVRHSHKKAVKESQNRERKNNRDRTKRSNFKRLSTLIYCLHLYRLYICFLSTMMLLRPAIGLFTWYAYSAAQRNVVKRNSFASMLLVSELRHPDGGDLKKLVSVAEKLPAIDTLSDSWVPLSTMGTGPPAADANTHTHTSSIRTTKDIAVAYHQYTQPQSTESASASASGTLVPLLVSASLFVREKPPTQSLPQLVSQRTTKPLIVQDVYERLNWMNAVDECVPAADTASLKDKIYTFCFRDYPDHEEMMAIMCWRWGMERLLLRIRWCGEFSVDSAKKCRLNEWFAVLGVLPLKIEWQGEIRDYDNTTTTSPPAIHWTTTSIRLGWKRFGKTFDKPPTAEKLRKEPWEIYLPVNGNGDIVVLRRLGKGKIVYAREECMKA